MAFLGCIAFLVICLCVPYGMTFRRKSMVAIFNEVSTGENQLNDTLAHEIGHRQGLKKGVGGVFGHIDAVSNQFTHCGSDSCLMSYARDRNNGIVELVALGDTTIPLMG